MKFKEWLFTESQWVTLDNPITINGITCNNIDFRFEDYGRKGFSFITGSFSAPLKNGNWLNYTVTQTPDMSNIPDFATYKAMKAKNQGIKLLGHTPLTKIDIAKQPKHQVLPDDWLDYAALYLGDTLQNEPKHPRGYFDIKGSPFSPQNQNMPITPKWKSL